MAVSAHDPVGIGVIGGGAISAAYLATLAVAPELRVVRCADLDPDRALRAAALAGAIASTPAELLADPAVELVVSLTPPAAHATVALEALAAGKHVFGEKPLATTRDDAGRVLAAAAAAGLSVGCAPDTFLGAAWRRARALIDGGAIGTPVAARATMQGPGPEGWHPDPAFFYRAGGGPLLDMGPYYVAALVALLGPVAAVTASERRTRSTRTVGSGPRAGERLPVEVATHVAAVLELAAGPLATLVTSFDCADRSQSIEIWGDAGTLLLPDPNFHGGEVRLRGADPTAPFAVVDGTGTGEPYRRGDGVRDLARALRAGAPHAASGELALHVLDTLLATHESAAAGRRVELSTTCDRPETGAA